MVNDRDVYDSLNLCKYHPSNNSLISDKTRDFCDNFICDTVVYYFHALIADAVVILGLFLLICSMATRYARYRYLVRRKLDVRQIDSVITASRPEPVRSIFGFGRVSESLTQSITNQMRPLDVPVQRSVTWAPCQEQQFPGVYNPSQNMAMIAPSQIYTGSQIPVCPCPPQSVSFLVHAHQLLLHEFVLLWFFIGSYRWNEIRLKAMCFDWWKYKLDQIDESVGNLYWERFTESRFTALNFIDSCLMVFHQFSREKAQRP